MALAHKVVVLSSCCAVACLNSDEKTEILLFKIKGIQWND